jgi:hypothetical protein
VLDIFGATTGDALGRYAAGGQATSPPRRIFGE